MEWLIYIISPMQTECKICKRFVDSSAPRWRRYCLPSVPQRLYRRHLALFIVPICPSLLFCAALLASAERIESSAHRTKSQNGTLARPRRHTDLFFFEKMELHRKAKPRYTIGAVRIAGVVVITIIPTPPNFRLEPHWHCCATALKSSPPLPMV